MLVLFYTHHIGAALETSSSAMLPVPEKIHVFRRLFPIDTVVQNIEKILSFAKSVVGLALRLGGT